MKKFEELRKEPKYPYEPEKDEHKATKKMIYDCLKKNDNVDRLYVREEFDDFNTRRRPDVGGVHNNKQLAVEVVNLNEDAEVCEHKQFEYHELGIYVAWVYTSERMHEYIEQELPPSEMMLNLLRWYGALYYCQQDKLIPVFYHYGHWVESPLKLDITWDTLCSLELSFKMHCQFMYDVDNGDIPCVEASQDGIDDDSKCEDKPCKGILKLEEGETVRCKYIDDDVDFFDNNAVVLDMGTHLKINSHTDLVNKLAYHMNELCDITLLKNHTEDDPGYVYDVEFVE